MQQQASFNLVETFAEIWRTIGQPDIEKCCILVTEGSKIANVCNFKRILDMPIIYVETIINGLDIGIGVIDPKDIWIANKFSKEATTRF